MIESAFTWLRSLKDPLRNANAATRWIAALPAGDPMPVQQAALEVVVGFPGPRRAIGPAQVEALLGIDARLEPVVAQLTAQYAQEHQQSSAVETRLWHSVFDLVKAFGTAYQAALKAGYPHAETKRWRALLPWVLVRLAHYKGIDGKFRLFRYGRWIPAQWRELHDLYEFARLRGWQREQLVFGAGSFARAGVCVEQEYLKALMLMRLDSGNFTPDQVEWVARQLDDWTPSLVLVPPPGSDATFHVDLTSREGLRRQSHRQPTGRSLFLDTSPVYARIVERMRWLPEQDEDAPRPGDLPAREQRLLLMRLAALFGPDALATTPRAPRVATDAEVRVVSGLAAACRAIAEIERLPEDPRAWRPVRGLNVVLLAAAAAAAALGVARLAGPTGGALAFALVAVSPALHATSRQLMSENLAAAHFALAGLALLALARGQRSARVAAVAVLATLPLTRAEAVVLLPVALAVVGRAETRRPAAERRRAPAALLALTALALALPSVLWLARNSARLGHPVLSDRGGLALAVRAELDAEVGRHGARSAALAWTPLEAARRAAQRAAPQASWLDYRPSGPGNFYLRTLRRWQQERARPGVDPLAVDIALGRTALARMARAPWDHARAAAAVAVRGMFAEASPRWARPFDLALALGLLLAAGIVVATAVAFRRRELPALAFLAPAWFLFGFHVAATELLPRYAVPLLPLAWSALVLAVSGARWGEDRDRDAPGVP